MGTSVDLVPESLATQREIASGDVDSSYIFDPSHDQDISGRLGDLS